MFELTPNSRSIFDPLLVHEKLLLRPPTVREYPQWRDLREESREHLTEWEQDWAPIDASLSSYKRRLKIFEREKRRKTGLALHVFERDTDRLVGGATLTNIRYGAAQACVLGYWIGKPFTCKGYGAATAAAVSSHAINAIGLNRVEAACQPGNIASKKVLERCGFVKEGVAEDYLRINGEWRAHELHALTARNFHISDPKAH
ncbi:MAG: GNAT family N-acetyltransferase [Marinicaulis sp.]|nr:GNAT family N-acetyltransferase [Marinicaulis sp.]NNE40869.1 GNAT family N-acetyltransferase [Marinicaulis sp.]NNL87801.1 GNAT family N-acetyltransferase [Marinicaulis sp.]